jgi:hypothetical protein
MNFRRLFVPLALVIAIPLLAGCGGDAEPTPTPSGPLPTLIPTVQFSGATSHHSIRIRRNNLPRDQQRIPSARVGGVQDRHDDR